jgi:hypothetical protein
VDNPFAGSCGYGLNEKTDANWTPRFGIDNLLPELELGPYPKIPSQDWHA